MKTLILVNDAYGASIGGIENSIRHLSAAAKQLKWEAIVVAGDANTDNAELGRLYEDTDAPEIFRYSTRPIKWLGVFNLPLAFMLQTRLLGRLRSASPEAVIVSRFHLSVLSARLAGFTAVRYLVPGMMADQYRAGLSKIELIRRPGLLIKCWFHAIIQKYAIRLSVVYVFSTLMHLRCDDLISNRRSAITITRPGVDGTRFYLGSSLGRTELRESLGLPLGKRLVLFAGRFVAAKGVGVLIESLQFLPRDVELVLVGGGESKQNFMRQIELAGLQDRVHLRSPTHVIEEYFRCCDVFAMSSVYEPFGQTIVEALASGLPVVAFSSQAGVQTATQELGFDEYITYSNEYTACALAKSLELQLSMPIEKREAQSQKALGKFSWPRLLDDLIR